MEQAKADTADAESLVRDEKLEALRVKHRDELAAETSDCSPKARSHR
jgi:hypothetical protein